MYDVTRRDTLDAIARHWLPEVERYTTYPDAVKMVVGNKIDMVCVCVCVCVRVYMYGMCVCVCVASREGGG